MNDRSAIRPTGDPRSRRATAPTWMHDGLAVYVLGAGPPLLVMPNPQGMVLAPQARVRWRSCWSGWADG
jgi:hypothetical protein